MLKPLSAVALGVFALVLALAGPAEASKCAVCKEKAVCKKVCCLLKTDEKAELKGVQVDQLAVQKCKSRFSATFAECESLADCLTIGDTATMEAKVDSFVQDVVNELDPTTTTTTTTTSTTTTSTTLFPPCTTPNTACGSCVVGGICFALCDHGCALACIANDNSGVACTTDAECTSDPVGPLCIVPANLCPGSCGPTEGSRCVAPCP
jgi:hypothetical protein